MLSYCPNILQVIFYSDYVFSFLIVNCLFGLRRLILYSLIQS